MPRDHKRNNNRSAKAEREEKLSTLEICDIHNKEVIEKRARKDMKQQSEAVKKVYVSAKDCPVLYNSPTLNSKDTEDYMRNSQYRVIEQGLKLY